MVITGIVGLGGALIGGGFTLAGTLEAAEAEAAAQERDLRRVAYVEYIDALDSYATAAASRWESCRPGSDDRRVPNTPCQPALADYQAKRFAIQGERNDMELIASDEALSLATAIGQTLPNSNVGLTGEPLDSEPVPRRFAFLYTLLLEVAACDTSPNPREDCPSVRAWVNDETGLANFTEIIREQTGRESDPSERLQEFIDRLEEKASTESEAPG